MHLLIYRERPDVKAVCHAHPPHGTAFAVAGLAIDQPILSGDPDAGLCAAYCVWNSFNRRINRVDAAVRAASQCALDGESRCGRLWRRSLAGVGSS